MKSQIFSRLLSNLPLSPTELKTLIITAPHRYKDHYIEKRNNRGRRLISQPTAELKLVQRALISTELSSLPVSSRAMAYVTGRNIRSHAAAHSESHFLLKMDFKDFFPSITPRLFFLATEESQRFDIEDKEILSKLLFRHDNASDSLRLSIGAPSSPHVSNIVMWRFDQEISEYCDTHKVKYTRYADDLAFSTNTPRILDNIQQYATESSIRLLGISINKEKTVNISKKHRRTLTGLVLANDGSISIPRNDRKVIRSRIHNISLGKIDFNITELCGKLAFTQSIDPDFVKRTLERYGFKSIDELSKQANKPS